MQTSYTRNPARGQAGLKADSGLSYILSLLSREVIGLGRGLVQVAGQDGAARLPKANYVELLGDADLVTSNSTVVTLSTTPLNGNATEYTTSATVYATSHAATMTAIAAKIAALDGVDTCTVGGTDGRTFLITAEDNYEISGVSATTTLGAGQAGWTATYETTDELLAAAMLSYDHEQPGLNKGHLSQATIVLDADFVASNVIAGYVNGTAVSVTYASSHANTMSLLKAAVEACPGVAYAVVDTRTLTIHAIPGGWQLGLTTFAITGGASQAGVTTTATNPDNATSGLVEFQIGDMIPGLQRGSIFVTVEQAVNAGDAAYLRYKSSGVNTPGGWRKDADTSTAVLVAGAKFMTTAAAGSVAVLSINLP